MGAPRVDERWLSTTSALPLVVTAAVITVLRQPDALLAPQLWAEDGAVWLAQAYNDGALPPIVRPHTGYLQVYSRLVAALAVQLPLVYAP